MSKTASIIAVNIAEPQAVTYRGKPVQTGIFKRPVDGPVSVHALGLDGDVQIDKRYHGGIDKAIYLYASEHYGWWRDKLGVDTLDWGAFGENLTTAGLL
jgi:MOSC domain-containing protein YiiM